MTFKEALDKFAQWLIMSSSNPDAVSLGLRGVAIAAIPTVMLLMGTLHAIAGVPLLDQQTFIDGINAAFAVLVAILVLVGKSMALFGFARKIWNTFVPKK